MTEKKVTQPPQPTAATAADQLADTMALLVWLLTNHERQELEYPLAALLAGVIALRWADELLADKLRRDQQHRQRQVSNGVSPANGGRAVYKWQQP